MIIAVPLNTVTVLTDRTVTFQPGDYPFIQRETAVSYDLLALFPVTQMIQLERMNEKQGYSDKTFVRHRPIHPDVLARIIGGALTSDLAPKGIVKKLTAINTRLRIVVTSRFHGLLFRALRRAEYH